MKQYFAKFFLFGLLAISLFSGCDKQEDPAVNTSDALAVKAGESIEAATSHYDNEGPYRSNTQANRSTGFTETFESGTKNAYARGTVNLSAGSWDFSDALIGWLPNDRKYGQKAVRMRNNGFAVMNFDLDNGAKTIRVRHARYGNDGNASWRLVASYDRGSSWSYVGSAVNTSSTLLNTVAFEVNESRSVRYGLSKISGGSNRINFDNFEVIVEGNGGGGNGEPAMDSNLTFGNPSDANNDPNNFFLSKPDFTMSYNESRGTANWVSWHLSTAWRGSTSRCNCFQQDRSLPSSFFSPTQNDYRGSGFHRGHICPSADRTYNRTGNANTFFMTNMAPQAPENNTRPWVGLENYLRTLIAQGNEIHIIAGVSGSGGTGSNGYRSSINNGNITVPDSFWKVALVLPNGTNDINRVTTSTRMIAVNMPNDQGISADWRSFITSVDDIERLTGYDFFENIPDQIEAVLEARK